MLAAVFCRNAKQKNMEVGFSVNLHDKDGDVWSKCLLLHFDETIILKLNGVKDLKDLIKQLKKIEKEVVENYGLS